MSESADKPPQKTTSPNLANQTADEAGDAIFFGTLEVDKDLVRLYTGIAIFIILLVAALSNPPIQGIIGRAYYPEEVLTLRVESGAELIEQLKKNDLWQIVPDTKISEVVFANYPDNLDQLQPDIRKKTFLHTLLPAVMVALSEVDSERAALKMILGKLCDYAPSPLNFEDLSQFKGYLSSEEIHFLAHLSTKYRTSIGDELLTRVNVMPISLIMAQGAIESSWGSSRFVLEGNNIFGIWTWDGLGIVPDRREDGKNHQVAKYDNMLDSVRAYILMINRVPAYLHFREIRKQTMDPIALANGLLYYSERRQDYVTDIKKVIQNNQLRRYDTLLSSPQS